MQLLQHVNEYQLIKNADKQCQCHYTRAANRVTGCISADDIQYVTFLI